MAWVFADTGYWIAVLLPGDRLHDRATAKAVTYDEATVATTQMVLTEFLNHVSGMGLRTKLAAARLVEDIGSNPNVEIIPQSDAQFRAAVERYADRGDQRWSLTDCASFLVMEEHGITEALAYDRDFEQAGFIAPSERIRQPCTARRDTVAFVSRRFRLSELIYADSSTLDTDVSGHAGLGGG